jgi:hypothetical protein
VLLARAARGCREASTSQRGKGAIRVLF